MLALQCGLQRSFSKALAPRIPSGAAPTKKSSSIVPLAHIKLTRLESPWCRKEKYKENNQSWDPTSINRQISHTNNIVQSKEGN